MDLKCIGTLIVGLACLLVSAAPEPGRIDTASLNNIANVSYAAENANPIGLASIFSPRMDFDQWRPLTGRGDPLRNDPTYDYEPPVLDRVHYWADDSRLEREHYPERKSEVLVLGVSSRKPSVAHRQPPPRRHHRPHTSKYEDYSYRLSDHFPMTILVPPPPPPPGHKPSLYVLHDKHVATPSNFKVTDPPKFVKETTLAPEHETSQYALQESNLIYQSSTTSQNWIQDSNQTQFSPNTAVSSDYAGWGPTTSLDIIDAANDTHNLIYNDHIELSKQPYSFYKPMLSESPPPPRVTTNPLLPPSTFVPTALPPLPQFATTQATVTEPQPTWIPERTTTEASTFNFDYNEETTTDRVIFSGVQTTPTGFTSSQPNTSILDMLSPMITMPLVNGPDRPEDNLYAHASENIHVYKDHQIEDSIKLETMQTMHPPPVVHTETTPISRKRPFHVNSHLINSLEHKQPLMHTRESLLLMRITTPKPTEASIQSTNFKTSTEAPSAPMYLIIQGHSKVKTYSSKPKPIDENDTINNEIPKPNETNEVKHLHPLKEKYSSQKTEKGEIRKGKAQNLKALIDEGRGSIEIQETDLGIKYDVSDGSGVPIELYRKGIVDNDENDYSKTKTKRTKRQLPVSIDEILPVDEDKLEKMVYDYLKGRQNSTGISGLLSKVVTGGISSLLDDIEDEDDDDDDGDTRDENDDDDDDDDFRR